MLCSGHSDAVLAVAAHPSSQFIFITSSRVCRIPLVCKYIIVIGKSILYELIFRGHGKQEYDSILLHL